MPTENALKWAAALESGEFEQGYGSLNKDGKFCCLGVACEVAIREGVPVKVDVPYEGGACHYDRDDALLPASVQAWLGLANNDGAYEGGRSLIGDNDARELTFKEIAQIIRTEDSLYAD
jgi:hypothetical protein